MAPSNYALCTRMCVCVYHRRRLRQFVPVGFCSPCYLTYLFLFSLLPSPIYRHYAMQQGTSPLTATANRLPVHIPGCNIYEAL